MKAIYDRIIIRLQRRKILRLCYHILGILNCDSKINHTTTSLPFLVFSIAGLFVCLEPVAGY